MNILARLAQELKIPATVKTSRAKYGVNGLYEDGRNCGMANEKRLIDANAFFEKLEKSAELLRQGKISEIDLNLLIASMPTVDAVEVVRCKDFVHRKERVCAMPYAGMWVGVELKDNDFCSYGERREGE